MRIQKEAIRRADLGTLFSREREDEARTEVANFRLQAIASLPHLAIFSDEAHHTYGQSLYADLKKVRKTFDYLAANTNLVCRGAFQAALEQFGRQGVVELGLVMGNYSLLALLINSFDTDLPPDRTEPLLPV